MIVFFFLLVIDQNYRCVLSSFTSRLSAFLSKKEVRVVFNL